MLQREKKFVFRGIAFTVKFPNVGQTIDMESLKQALTNGNYGLMVASNIGTMNHALDLVDTVVFFQVCCPQVKNAFGDDLPKGGLIELSIDACKDLVKCYREEVFPWYNSTLRELYDTTKPEEEAEGAAND